MKSSMNNEEINGDNLYVALASQTTLSYQLPQVETALNLADIEDSGLLTEFVFADDQIFMQFYDENDNYIQGYSVSEDQYTNYFDGNSLTIVGVPTIEAYQVEV